jgi:hypothetical protein
MSTPLRIGRVTKPDPEHPDAVPALLRMLKVNDASVEKQAAVLRVWLKANTPTARLRLSLLANGYGHILDEAVGRRPSRTIPPHKHSA